MGIILLTIENIYNNHLGLILIFYSVVVLAGIILGWKQKIVVFKNYDDLILSICFFVIPVFVFLLNAMGFISSLEGFPFVLFLSVELLLLSLILICSWQSNKSFLSFLLAFFTKMPLSIFFSVLLFQIIDPSGKTEFERKTNRNKSIAFLVLLTPVLYKLVRNKEGFWQKK